MSSLIGSICCSLYKVGIIALGIWLGILSGILINTLLLSAFESNYTIWVAMIICALICGGITMVYYKQILISTTSLFGAYCILKAVGVVFGGFPNEFTLINEIKYGTAIDLKSAFMGYIFGIVIMTIAGIYF